MLILGQTFKARLSLQHHYINRKCFRRIQYIFIHISSECSLIYVVSLGSPLEFKIMLGEFKQGLAIKHVFVMMDIQVDPTGLEDHMFITINS